jgi:hypothetical protein
MSKKPQYDLEIKSIKSFLKSADYLAAVKLQCEMLPEYMPNKWDVKEPIKQIFDPHHLEQLIYPNGNTDNIFWKRIEKPKADGSWRRSWGRSRGLSDSTHATIDISVYESTHQEKLLAYLKAASILNEADISALDSNVDKGKELVKFVYHLPNGVTSFQGISAGLDLSTHTLRHWLPDMPWVVVFGSAYVRMFGKQKLLTCPAYKVEDLGEEMVFIQLTPNMTDIHEKYDEVVQARATAKNHLGEECFFKAELAYDFRNANWGGPSEEEIAAKQGKVFRVPTFELKPD